MNFINQIKVGDNIYDINSNILLSRIQGTSTSSSASQDPFKFLGNFTDPNGNDLHTALNNLHSTNKEDGYEGIWRFTVADKPATLYNLALNYTQDSWVQGLISVYSPYTGSGNHTFGVNNKFNILYRTHKNDRWSEWEIINENEMNDIKTDLLRTIETTNNTTNETLLSRIQGTSTSSSASQDPFKFLGEFSDPNGDDLHKALNDLHSTSKSKGYEGIWRFTVLGKPATLYNLAMNYPQDNWVQGLISVYTPYTGSGNYTFSINNKFNILYRTCTNGEWSKWENVITNIQPNVTIDDEKLVKKNNFVQTKTVTDDKGTYLKTYIISKYNATTDIVITFAKTLLFFAKIRS